MKLLNEWVLSLFSKSDMSGGLERFEMKMNISFSYFSKPLLNLFNSNQWYDNKLFTNYEDKIFIQVQINLLTLSNICPLTLHFLYHFMKNCICASLI